MNLVREQTLYKLLRSFIEEEEAYMLRLSKKEQAVLAAIEFDADAPLVEFEKPLRMPVSTIRYHVNNLLQRRIVRYYPFINTLALGYTPYSIFFALTPHGKKQERALIEALQKHSEVSWCAQFGGPYQFCVTILTKGLGDITKFLDKLADKFGDLFSKKQIVGQTSFTLFQTKYLYEASKADRYLTWNRPETLCEIDSLDGKILSGVLSPTFESRRELARALGTPIATVDGRLRKLREKEIIQGALYLIIPQNLSMFCFKLLVHAQGLSTKLHQELFKFCHSHKNITTLIRCVGSWDYEIGVEVSSSEEILDITHELQTHFGETITLIEELSQFREHKVCCYPFSEELSPRRR